MVCVFSAMSKRTKSLVFGYVRGNYHLYVPEVIVKRCLLYFDPEVVMKLKGKDFEKFVESPAEDNIMSVTIIKKKPLMLFIIFFFV